MEVQVAWLEEANVEEAPTSSKRRPPRLPGSKMTLPPMPVVPSSPPPPQRRATMEVDMSWVEVVDERKKARSSRPAPSPESKPRHTPIRREED
jgi:hypothetical protein